MRERPFPVIDPVATGMNIVRLRKARGLSVRDLQRWFGFEDPRAIYKWQTGQSLPTVDHLLALSALLEVSMNEIIVCKAQILLARQGGSCCAIFLCGRAIIILPGALPVIEPLVQRRAKYRPRGQPRGRFSLDIQACFAFIAATDAMISAPPRTIGARSASSPSRSENSVPKSPSMHRMTPACAGGTYCCAQVCSA